MNPSHLPTSRGGRIAPSTLVHVLSLVQRVYVPRQSAIAAVPVVSRTLGAVPKAMAKTYVSGDVGTLLSSRATARRRVALPPFGGRPYASSAHAVLQHEPPDALDYHHQYQDAALLPNPETSLFPGSPPLPTGPEASSRATFSRQAITSKTPALPKPLAKCLDNPSSTAAQFRGMFERRSLPPHRLASVHVLERSGALWLRTAEPSTWAWLSGQLGHIISDSSDGQVDPRVIQLARAVRAYAYVVLGQVWQARQQLSAFKDKERGQPDWNNPSLFHAFRGLAYGRLEEWEEGRREMVLAVRRGLKASTCPRADLTCLQTYDDMLRSAGKVEDMITLILESGKRLQHLLVNHGDEKEQEGQLADFFLAALARITDPAEWLYNQFAHSEKNLRWIGNALLAALSRNNTNGNDALATLRVLQDFDCPMPPDAASRVALQLSEVGSYQEAREVIKRLQEQYLDLPRIPLSRALAVFVKQGDIPAAEEVWKEIDKRFTPSTQDRFLLARVYAQRGIVPTTVSLLRNGLGDALDEDVQALSLIQLAYINALDVNSAAVYLDRIIAIKPCLIAFNRMLSLHASRADVDSAIRTFDSILDHGLRPNRSSYTSLISLFANRRDLANAQNVFHAMAEAGIAPDAVSWAAMLNAEVETGHWVAAAERWNNLPANAKSDKNVITTILKAFVLLASPTSHVLALFRSVKRPNGHLWALAIQSAADNGDLELARSLFDEMDTQALASPTSPKPGVSHLSILLHAYLRENLADEARAMYDEMLNRGIVPSSITYGMIISSFSTISGQHSLDQAHDFAMSIYRQARAEVSRARGTVNENLFGPLLLASGRAGETDDATLYFDLASSPVVSIHSSVHSHTKLMDAYRRAGKVDSVLEVWSKAFQLACDMTARKVNTASVAISTTRVADNILCMPLSIVLDSLSSVGRHADVKRVWNEVRDAGFGFDSQNYNHYAVALARTGDVESAFAVVDRILIARWDEVKERRIAARRATKHLDPVPPAQGEPKIDDIPVAPAFRPPNRRHEQRWDEGDPSRLNSDGANVQLLETWRPTDILWRPSMLTISVLEHAYKQLEEAKFRRAWLGLTSDEAEMEGDVEDSGAISEAAKDRETEALAGSGGDEVFTFPSFGNAPLRDLDGSPRKISASAMIVKLNRKYLKVVSLITLHRRKRAARLEREATRR